jgi:hypothetical protein
MSAPTTPPLPLPAFQDPNLPLADFLEQLAALARTGRVALSAVTVQVRSEDGSSLYSTSRCESSEGPSNDIGFGSVFFRMVADVSGNFARGYQKESEKQGGSRYVFDGDDVEPEASADAEPTK